LNVLFSCGGKVTASQSGVYNVIFTRMGEGGKENMLWSDGKNKKILVKNKYISIVTPSNNIDV